MEVRRTMSEMREPDGSDPMERWPAWRTTAAALVWRTLFCYFALYSVDVLVFVLQRLILPRNTGYAHPWLTGYVWDWLVPWIGQHVLHLKAAVVVNNIGGDVPFEFLLRGTELAIAVVFGALWKAMDGRRKRDAMIDPRCDAWLRVVARMALASVMLYYGFGKLIPMQFGTLTLHRLSRPLGELSPMGMLWAFMAASKGYTILCGAVEVVGGLLLLVPELSMLGAFVSAGAMANVFVLNVFYDVNQKVRSLSYLLLAIYLLAPIVRRLFDVLLWNRRSEAVPVQAVSPRRWVQLTLRWLPLICGLVFLGAAMPSQVRAFAAQQHRERTPIFGVWAATEFAVADAAKPLFTHKLIAELQPDAEQYHWKRLIFDVDHEAMIQFSSGEWDGERYTTQSGAAGGPIQTVLTDFDDASWKCSVVFVPLPGNRLQMTGSVNGNEVRAVFQREDGDRAYHVTDPPRWISDGDRNY